MNSLPHQLEHLQAGTLQEILNHVSDGVYVLDHNRRIIFWNQSAQRITGFGSDEVIGHCCADNILTHTNENGCKLCMGQCPVSSTLHDRQPRQAIVYLHHKDGHRLPVHVDVRPILNPDNQLVAVVETFRECSDIIAMRSLIERLKQWGCIDLTTGLLNRRIIEVRLNERIQEFQRFGWHFGILLIEVDFQKELLARWGQPGLNQVLRMTAQTVVNSLRSLDAVGRWDEGVFLAIISNTSIAELTLIAERIRAMVDSSFRVTPDGEMHATVSIGAVAASQNDQVESLLQKAQRSLYTSRMSGRNRISVYGLPQDL